MQPTPCRLPSRRFLILGISRARRDVRFLVGAADARVVRRFLWSLVSDQAFRGGVSGDHERVKLVSGSGISPIRRYGTDGEAGS